MSVVVAAIGYKIFRKGDTEQTETAAAELAVVNCTA